MDFSYLTDANIWHYAVENYYNPSCQQTDEFLADFDRIKYVKRLMRRYKTKGVLKEHLCLNHLIVIFNVFGPEPATRMLYHRINPDLWPILKAFMIHMGYDLSADIEIDPNVAERLAALKADWVRQKRSRID